MKCPHCANELILPNRVLHNLAYGKPLTSVTECCGKLLRVAPVRSYRVELVDPTIRVDDWGYSENLDIHKDPK